MYKRKSVQIGYMETKYGLNVMSTHLFYLLSAPQHFIVYTQKIFFVRGPRCKYRETHQGRDYWPRWKLKFFFSWEIFLEIHRFLRNAVLNLMHLK